MNIQNQKIQPNGIPETGANVRFKVANYLGNPSFNPGPGPGSEKFCCKNQIVNGSFDGWVNKQIVNGIPRLTPGTIPPDFWISGQGDTYVEIAGCLDNYTPLARDQVVSSGCSILNGSSLTQILMNLKPSKKYYVNFWAKTVNVGKFAVTNGGISNLNVIISDTNDVWTQFIGDFTTDAVGTDINLIFGTLPMQPQTSLDIDNVLVVEGIQQEFYPNPGDHHVRATTYDRYHIEANGGDVVVVDNYDIADIRAEIGVVPVTIQGLSTEGNIIVPYKVPFTYKALSGLCTIKNRGSLLGFVLPFVSIDIDSSLSQATIFVTVPTPSQDDETFEIFFAVFGV